MSGGIYQIENLITGMIYIGSAKDFQDRWRGHLYDLRRDQHINIHLQRSYNKHGEDAFAFSILFVLGDYDKQTYFDKENQVMSDYRAAGKSLYNIAMAQGGWSFHDEESKAKIATKISSSLKKKNAELTKEERQAKFTIWSKDNPLPDWARQKISKKLTGIKRSDETRAKMKEAQQQEHIIEAKREIMREVGRGNAGRAPPNKGQKASNETRLKQSLAKKGKPMSEENKALRRGKPAINRIPVVIDDIEFESKSAAAKFFGKSITWVTNRINNDRKNTYKKN